LFAIRTLFLTAKPALAKPLLARSKAPVYRSAGFQTCRIADFQVGWPLDGASPAGLETRDTAGLETCATVVLETALRW